MIYTSYPLTLFMGLMVLMFESPWQIEASTAQVFEEVIIGMESMGLGFLILYYLIASAGILCTSITGYFLPIFAIFMSHMLLGED